MGLEQHLEGFNPELLQGLVFVNRKVLQASGQLRVDVDQHALLAHPRGPRSGGGGGWNVWRVRARFQDQIWPLSDSPLFCTQWNTAVSSVPALLTRANSGAVSPSVKACTWAIRWCSTTGIISTS